MSTHRVHTLEIELNTADSDQARALMDRISGMRADRIGPTLDRVFGALSPPGRPERLDRLELDLGELPELGFDDAFLERLEEVLTEALQRALRGAPAPQPGASELELLHTFAATGTLPWWAEHHRAAVVEEALLRARTAEPVALAALVDALEPLALPRLALACSDAALAALAPALWARLEPPAWQDPELRGALLAFSLSRLPEDAREAVFSAQLRRAEARSPTVRGATRVAPSAGEPRPGSAEPPEAPSRPKLGPNQASDPDLEAPIPSDLDWSQVRDGDLGADPPSISVQDRDELLLSPSSDEAEDPHLPPNTGLNPSAREPVRGALPANEPDALSPDPALEDTKPALARPVATPPAEPTQPAATPPAEPPRPGAPTPSTRPPPPRRLPPALETLALDDAGLVILWPFLERFFTRLELLDPDRRFTPASRAAAIGLVSALASGDANPPEWRLPLPKLLCGLQITDPVWLPRPPDPAHLEESNRLLQAVIANARVLREMSVPEFQRTFLRRDGTLELRNGAWLLRVERQPWDLLLDRFPWSWSWIRLPWMPDSIQVEW